MPNIAPIVNEILSRPGWVSGNYVGITFIWIGSEAWNAYPVNTQEIWIAGPGDPNHPLYDFGDIVPPPASPIASASSARLSNVISWTDIVGATSYNIYWSYIPGVTTADTKISDITSPYIHLGLDKGVTIYYIVTAVGSSPYFLESLPSNEVSATPFGATVSEGHIIW
jgi:hypothetical protein